MELAAAASTLALSPLSLWGKEFQKCGFMSVLVIGSITCEQGQPFTFCRLAVTSQHSGKILLMPRN